MNVGKAVKRKLGNLVPDLSDLGEIKKKAQDFAKNNHDDVAIPLLNVIVSFLKGCIKKKSPGIYGMFGTYLDQAEVMLVDWYDDLDGEEEFADIATTPMEMDKAFDIGLLKDELRKAGGVGLEHCALDVFRRFHGKVDEKLKEMFGPLGDFVVNKLNPHFTKIEGMLDQIATQNNEEAKAPPKEVKSAKKEAIKKVGQ